MVHSALPGPSTCQGSNLEENLEAVWLISARKVLEHQRKGQEAFYTLREHGSDEVASELHTSELFRTPRSTNK